MGIMRQSLDISKERPGPMRDEKRPENPHSTPDAVVQLGQLFLALVPEQGIAVKNGLGRVGVIKSGILDVLDQLRVALFIDVNGHGSGTVRNDGGGCYSWQDALDVCGMSRLVVARHVQVRAVGVTVGVGECDLASEASEAGEWMRGSHDFVGSYIASPRGGCCW